MHISKQKYQTKEIAHFDIDFLQFINKDGQAIQPLPEALQTPEKLIDLYRNMVLTRLLDTKAVNLQRTGKMGTYPSAYGQEAVGTGMAAAMGDKDIFCPYYRDQATFLYRGVKVEEILAYWGGDERGSDFQNPKVKHDFPTCVPIGTQLLHAAGIGYALKYRHEQRAVLTICGDGGTSQGDFYEAINFCGNFNLPVVFMINNNQWAISVPRDHQTACKTLAQKAIAAGLKGIQVDGNDVVAVYAAVAEALEQARFGQGGCVIEAMTYRLCDHTTADDATRYVNPDDLAHAKECEPIVRLRTYMHTQGFWDKDKETALQKECSNEVEAAVKAYQNMSPQATTDLIDYLYEELPAALHEQRAALGAEG